MKINELKTWLWDTVLENDQRIPLDAQLVFNVDGVVTYAFGENLDLTKNDGDEPGDSITIKQFLNVADKFGDKEIDVGHTITTDYVYSPRNSGRTLWIMLEPNEGEAPVEETPAEAQSEATAEG